MGYGAEFPVNAGDNLPLDAEYRYLRVIRSVQQATRAGVLGRMCA